MAGSERNARSRLKASLKQLDKLSPATLARDDLQGRSLSFRAGVPYFERTLALFRGLGSGNLYKVPSAYLTIVADHAERALAQFEEVMRFTGENLPNPNEVRNHLIAEVRDYYRELHDDLSLLITPPSGQQQRTTAPSYMGTPLAVIMVLIFAAGLTAAYHYGLLGFAAQDLMDSIHAIARG